MKLKIFKKIRDKRFYKKHQEKLKQDLLLRAKEFYKTLPTIKFIDWATKEDVSKYVKIQCFSLDKKDNKGSFILL